MNKTRTKLFKDTETVVVIGICVATAAAVGITAHYTLPDYEPTNTNQRHIPTRILPTPQVLTKAPVEPREASVPVSSRETPRDRLSGCVDAAYEGDESRIPERLVVCYRLHGTPSEQFLVEYFLGPIVNENTQK